ncbi:hypothetical protein AZH53_08850 [Methanomicrobiaceae archaeon CYW5]|uniref:hypothetical protein n=1 Tax=Methanovulcanius yangii TaxID=1789227 RepID=UPI0029C9D625|nr:hypothetical protein [Methanovulcanius yangii]MBT8508513.1 hypothetical protein [Methanovulcanius yangii]
MQRIGFTTLCVLGLLVLLAVPAAGVLLEETYLGKVTKVDPANELINIKVIGKWNGEQYAPADPVILSATEPYTVAYDNIAQGDEVVATLMGGTEWIAIGRVQNIQSTEKPLSWMVGDPDAMPAPMMNFVRVGYEITPDCSNCSGTVCTGTEALVSVSQYKYEPGKMTETAVLATRTMQPGELWDYQAPEGYQTNMRIRYLAGEADVSACAGTGPADMMVGPQPVSAFTVDTYPKAQAVPTTAPTPVPTQLPATEEPTAEPTPAPTQLPETPEPTPTAVPGFAVIGAMAGLALAGRLLRR